MFRGDGTFAAGDAGRERYWVIRDGRLLVCGDDGHLTMALERKPDGSWQGRWLVYGKGVCTASLPDRCWRMPGPQACPFLWTQPAVAAGGLTTAAR